MATLKEFRDERIKKLNKLRSLGIDPYPAHSKKDLAIADILENFDLHENKEYFLAGRLMSLREHGNLTFCDLQDQSGKIQLYIKSEEIQNTNKNEQTLGFEDLKLLDIGDILQVYGVITKTKTGEVSILVKKLTLLTKSLRPLPDKHSGLKDQDVRYRRRYLDLLVNPEVRQMFERKSLFWEANREFLKSKGFIEVETPVMEQVTGGADAKPFVTHHDALDEDFYLRISTELYQKRLIGGGFEKIFTLGPNFRNEGIDDEHLQEFYQIEWYWAYADYRNNMELVKEMFRYVANKVYGKTKFEKSGHTFDLADEWKEIDYVKIIKETYGIDIFESSNEDILKILKANKVELPGTINRNRLIDNLWKLIRKTIAGPAFLVNEPKFMSPLAKSKTDNPNLTERFHIILAGSELGNGYSELNEPFDQLDRFKEQQGQREEGDDEAQMLDIDYVEMLEYGMPPTSGYGHSERLFWFLEGVTAREGTLFPQMRRKLDDTTKEIYGLKSPEQTKVKTTLEKDFVKEFNREHAQSLLEKYVKDDYQKLHANMVANVLDAYADVFGENKDLWYITGLLHDLDYFEFPEEHPNQEAEWFKEWGFPEESIHAVLAHYFDKTKVEPQTKLAAALIATDELSGLIYAYALMRPDRLDGMNASSVKKKFKDKAFAAKVSRDDINYGLQHFGESFEKHVEFMIDIFKKMQL